MQRILFDTNTHNNFLPISYTRSLADIRIGILTIHEKWSLYTNSTIYIKTKNYLQKKYNNLTFDGSGNFILINSSVLPDEKIANEIIQLKHGESLYKNNLWIASHTSGKMQIPEDDIKTEYVSEVNHINYLWDIFKLNETELNKDFKLLVKNRPSSELKKTNTLLSDGTHPVFIENGGKIEACTLNTLQGPIYIGKDAEIMEGSMLRGPLAVCENAQVKMGSKIYGATTIGPGCKVGGEINNSVFFANSNKAHDGFIGNSVIAEWCNLGADTNNSNLKNNYSSVKVWHEYTQQYIDTNLQFCGVFLADFARTGINTMLNTGTVAGVFANIFGGGFPPKNIPSFAWGGSDGFERFEFDKAIELGHKVKQRRKQIFSEVDYEIYAYINKITKS